MTPKEYLNVLKTLTEEWVEIRVVRKGRTEFFTERTQKDRIAEMRKECRQKVKLFSIHDDASGKRYAISGVKLDFATKEIWLYSDIPPTAT